MKTPLVALDVRTIGKDQTGDTTYWTGLVRGLSRLDSEVRYLLFSNAPRPPEIPESDRFQWVELHSHRERWWSLFRFPLVAKRMGARAFHVQYNLSPLITHGGITTIHDVSFYHNAEWFRPQDRLVLQRFVPASARRADRVLTVSEFSRREINRYISGVSDKVVVVPNACSEQVHQVADPTPVLKELGINGPYVLTVGTRWPRKNLQTVVDAVERLPDSLPHKLVVTGKPGWDEGAPGKRTLQTGFVSQEQLCALYSAADLYLAPSHYEGFGITLLEAFTCGCPVLASANGAHEEVAGEAAAFVPPSQGGAWTSAMEGLLNDPTRRSNLRELGSERAKMFNWDKSATMIEQVYREVAR